MSWVMVEDYKNSLDENKKSECSVFSFVKRLIVCKSLRYRSSNEMLVMMHCFANGSSRSFPRPHAIPQVVTSNTVPIYIFSFLILTLLAKRIS